MPDPRLLHTTSHGWHWVGSTWARLIALAGLGGAGLAYLTYLYASQVEPRWLDFNTRRLPLRRLDPAFDGYRIVQLTDFHLGRGKLLTPDRLETIVRRVNAGHPDLILFTGDFQPPRRGGPGWDFPAAAAQGARWSLWHPGQPRLLGSPYPDLQ